MKPYCTAALLGIALFFLPYCDYTKGNNSTSLKLEADSLKTIDSLNKVLLLSKAEEALQFCKDYNYNEQICLLINMNVHSGKHRFYVWDFNKRAAIDSGLVSHGCGTAPWSGEGSADKPIFSNVPDSHLSSLGKYKIGERAISQWGVGIKYNLHGLEATNNNALKRFIVFHSWESVGDIATHPIGSPESWGCPAVSNLFFLRVDTILQAADQPVLMWIFNE